MSNPANPKDWAQKAEEDYQIANTLLRRKLPLTYGSTFHAQQMAEKYLKGLLVLQSIVPPKTHDLVALAGLCNQVGYILPVTTVDLQKLSDYAIRSRYPGNDPTLVEAKDALKIAKSVRKFAKPLL